jgi:sugar phosphate isomerase/epimerase
VGSPWFGVTFDTGNFLRVMDDPVAAAKKLAKYTFATHIKDVTVRKGASPAESFFFSSTAIGDGLIDIAAVLRELQAVDFGGLLAVEIDYLHPDSPYDEPVAVRKSVAELRRMVYSLA